MPKVPISYLIFLRNFSAFSSYLVPILNSLPCLVHDGLPEVEIFVCLNIAPIRRRGMDCIKLLVSTRIVGTDTRMSNLDIRMFSLDTRMSRLDIRVSKVILESGKTKTAENSRLCVAFRMFFRNFCRPIG